MPRLDPRESQEALKERVTQAITGSFPIEGEKRTLRLKNVSIENEVDTLDIRSQKEAKIYGRTFGAPVYAEVELVDNATGKVLESSKRQVTTLPQITHRFSYIVDGTERQVENLWTLRPGVYSRIRQNGELESQINIKGGAHHIELDPKTKKFKFRVGTSSPPLYSVMRALGHTDEDLEKAWGQEIFAANKVENPEKNIMALAKKLNPYSQATTSAEASLVIRDRFLGAELDPEVTKETLGRPIDKLTPEAMLLTSKNLLKVSQGEKEPDDRESLAFKQLKGIEDFISDRILDQKKVIDRRVKNNIDRKDHLRQILGPDIFDRPVREFFAKSSLSGPAEDTNPVAMIGGHQKTTILGTEGGITSEHRLIEETKLVNPTHLGYLDGLHTPEGSRTGVTLHTALGAKKQGNQLYVNLYNTKTGKLEAVPPGEMLKKMVIMPDEVRWEKGKPVAKRDQVKAALPGGAMGLTDLKKADYIVPSAAQLFSLPLNLVPFLANNSQNRATMSGRHQEQAVALKYREPPLVQTVSRGEKTFDDIMGEYTAHRSQVEGTVVGVERGSIKIKTPQGKVVETPIYDNYPLNEKKGVLDSEPTVKVGDKVKKDQVIADTNFSKNGTYAPGINLRVGYMPARGENYEDGIVISESAAKKLTSLHMYKKAFAPEEGELLGVKKHAAYFPTTLTEVQRKHLDDQGVIKVGERVNPGDVIIAAARKRVIRPDDVDLGRVHKSLVRDYDDASLVWEQDHPGVVEEVHQTPKGTVVHINTEEPAQLGDKIVSRHANKGIISSILPDHEMPQQADGKPLEVLHNTQGVPGRMNLGQVLETAVSKVAEKTGKPVTVQNFELEDARTHVEDLLKKHKLQDKETVIDPKTGKAIPGILTGKQYTLKLHHQVEQKMLARSRGPYDLNLQPRGGAPHGGSSISQMDLYGLLAHGATHNIREMSTYKADRGQGGDNDDLWVALQTGELLPPPKTTFAYKKFEGMLKTMGVNAEKKGNFISLMPLTNEQILSMSRGEIKDGGRMVKAGSLEPERGGLFDPKVTGGAGGKHWGHIKLTEPMPNPVFERAITTVAGIKKADFDRILAGEQGVTAEGKLAPAGQEGVTAGPSAIQKLLEKVDVKTTLEAEKKRLPSLRGTELNEAYRRVKYLLALEKAGLSPKKAYLLENVPVMPPMMRPLGMTGSGNLQVDDLNNLYKHLAITNNKLKDLHRLAPDEERVPLRSGVYDKLKSLYGLGGTLNTQYPGILDTIAGSEPKLGYFQSKLVKRRQDMSLRSTIVPDTTIGLDEVGIPRKAAMEAYKPFVVRELKTSFGLSPRQAQEEIKQNTSIAAKALERVTEDRPLILKRDPVLHKHGIQAFKPKLIEGRSIKIHPLVTSGYNADFDGDAMAGFVPVSKEAVEEARKMMPSSILFEAGSGKVAYSPQKEMQVGLYHLSEVGKDSKLKFKDRAELEEAVKKGKLDTTDVATVGGVKTTLGRYQLQDVLPDPVRPEAITNDLNYRFTKKEQGRVFNEMARKDPKGYPEAVDRLKNVGNEQAFLMGLSIGLEDLKPPKEIRDPILAAARRDTKGLDVTKPADAQKLVDVYSKALANLEEGVKKKAEAGKTTLDKMEVSMGIKGNGYRQLVAAPLLYQDAKGDPVPMPVEKSYAEGLSSADYWASISGGRKGIIQKVQAVSEPGYLSKLMMNVSMSQLVTDHDCNTDQGISLPLDEPDLVGRYTQAEIKLGEKKAIPRGTLVTPEVLSELRKAKAQKVVVRSPLRCAHTDGICQKCAGLNEYGQLPDRGTNIGAIAAQSLGERGVQLSMKAFHSGGVVDPKGGGLVEGIERVTQLLNLNKKIKGSAVLATKGGAVQAIKKDPAGGWSVMIDGTRHYIPANRKLLVQVGGQIKRGDPLTRGPINPHELLPLTGVNRVQNYMAEEINQLYRPEGVLRRHGEVIIRNMTNISQVEDPGDHPDLIRGDVTNTAYLQKANQSDLKGKKPVVFQPILKGVRRFPLDASEDWMARMNHEYLKSTVLEGAQRGWKSDIHGSHPIPGIVYGAEFGKGTKTPY